MRLILQGNSVLNSPAMACLYYMRHAESLRKPAGRACGASCGSCNLFELLICELSSLERKCAARLQGCWAACWPSRIPAFVLLTAEASFHVLLHGCSYATLGEKGVLRMQARLKVKCFFREFSSTAIEMSCE